MSNPAKGDFDPAPSASRQPRVNVVDVLPAVAEAAALAVPVTQDGAPPIDLHTDEATLAVLGFTGKRSQTAVLVGDDGRALVAIGIGDPSTVGRSELRDLAGDLARAIPQHRSIAVELPAQATGPSAADFAQVVVEGVLLARWRFFVGAGDDEPQLDSLTIVAPSDQLADARAGAQRGAAIAKAAAVSRDLANCPATTLTATRLGDVATGLADESHWQVTVFGEEELIDMGCGGILGVNLGSTEPPALIKIEYSPDGASGHLGLVGKGIMYDSGGISLKPSDESHAQMKNDMTGAGAILGAMTALRAIGCRTRVTAYLCCTDNMPSGSAMKLGDVLTIRNGKTVEVLNTDAEGRLVMSDGLCLAVEDGVDAVVDIATLTGAALRALGVEMAAVMGNDQGVIDQLTAAGEIGDEPLWQLPLHSAYRSQLKSLVADLKNMGGPNAGSITAALFLEEFVGATPWAHLDIAGPAWQPAVRSWRNEGASGFGAKLLVEFIDRFNPPGPAAARKVAS